MEVIFIIMNVVMVSYVIYAVYQAWMYGHNMTDGAYHHFLSHLYIVLFFLISLNVFIFKGWIVPFLLTLAYTIQHLTKENLRLIKTGKWTPTVKDV